MICRDLDRREILENSDLNGIDYIEVPKDDQQNIRVYFIKPNDIPPLQVNQVRVEGGVRIRDIRVEDVKIHVNKYLEVHINQAGDFSTYTLIIENSDQVDSAFSHYPFSFKAGCPSDFDCHKQVICPPEPQETPAIDYMAKDYASFRQALLDLIPTLLPNWQERHEADLGITLVELLAYIGDQLSYYQDAIANEAYLETARQRESVRRHARLIDYTIHDGANARTCIHFTIKTGESVTIPECTRLAVLNRIDVPLGECMPPHTPVISDTLRQQALSAADVVFEWATGKKEEITFHSKLNEIKIYTWGNRLCCVPRGTITLHLVGDLPLNTGDLLLFEEVKGPTTGLLVDANLCHRQVVRVMEVKKTNDPLQKDPETGTFPMKLTQITWHRSDALTFPLCVSSQHDDGTFIDNVSVARGNLILADHGQTIDEEWHPANPNVDPKAPGNEKRNIAYRFELQNGPMTFHTPASKDGEEAPPVQEMLKVDPREAIAHASLKIDEDGSHWELVPNLLDSTPFDRHFVVETHNNERAVIRFGDGTYGMEPPQNAHIKVTYRVGNGAAGNVGTETLIHVLQPPNSGSIHWSDIDKVRNPLPAWGGIEPETMAQVKLLAPKAFHAEQFRAVTEDDYARAAEKHPEVDRAVATFRWTGSWHTVFVTIDPLGRTDLSTDLEESIRKHIFRYKLAGHDIEIDPPIYVPLEIEMNVCVLRDHFRAHVKEAVMEALSNQVLPNGTKGVFHPDNFTFGQSVYLSQLYTALEQVNGVDSAEVILFKRFGKEQCHELKQGYIPMGRLEIARLDNDPNFPENGILRLNMMGGK